MPREAAHGAPDGPQARAQELVAGLERRELLLGLAESITGGALAASLVDVPGASAVLRGGIVSYATEVKRAVLGVDATLLSEHGAVDPHVARQMADGARRVFDADVALATTGVAGPAPQDGQPVGTVYVAAAWEREGQRCTDVRRLALTGSRQMIREGTVEFAITWACELMGVGGAWNNLQPGRR